MAPLTQPESNVLLALPPQPAPMGMIAAYRLHEAASAKKKSSVTIWKKGNMTTQQCVVLAESAENSSSAAKKQTVKQRAKAALKSGMIEASITDAEKRAFEQKVLHQETEEANANAAEERRIPRQRSKRL